MAINVTTLFTRLGKFFYAGQAVQTALATTIEDEIEDAVQELGGANSIEYESVRNAVLSGLRALQAQCSSTLSTCVMSPSQALLIQTVKDDKQQLSDSLTYSLAELRSQMIDNSQSLDASSPSIAVSYGSNVGNGVLVIAATRADGLVNEHIFAEFITGVFVSAPTDGLASLQLTGEAFVSELAYNWPKGSGCYVSIGSHTASSSSNLVSNGTFETESDEDEDLPSDWIVSVGTTGSTVKLTNVEEQTVVMSGTPTSGYYLLHYTNGSGKIYTTIPIAYNASASTVEAALGALEGLGSISVASTGTSPDYTHTITFTGVSAPSQLTSTEYTDSGSLAHATTVAGGVSMVGARALEFDSNGAELTCIQQQVTLSAKTQYAVQMWLKTDVVPAAGRYVVDLVDGIGGTVVQDDQGANNSVYFDAANLTTDWNALSAISSAQPVFRTPSTLPTVVYLRLRATTAMSNTSSLYVDEMCMVPMTALYTGGPSLALFTGQTVWTIDDEMFLTVTNDRAGTLHEWCNRVFALRTSDFLLPTNNAGGETISDALVT